MSLALAMSLIVGHLEVVGPLLCPLPKEIRARLEELLSAAQLQRNHLFLVDRAEAVLNFWAFDPQGQLLTSRSLVAEGDCANQALAVAALVAAWETTLHTEIGEAPKVEPRAVVAPAAKVPAAVVANSRPLAPPRPAEGPSLPWRWALGAGLGGQWATTVSPAAEVSLRAAPPNSRLGLALTLGGALAHRADYLVGAVRWFETTLVLGPTLELPLGDWAIIAAVEGAANVRFVAGENFARNLSASLFAGGAGGSVRLDWRRAAARPWCLLRGLGWLQRQELFVAAAAPAFFLPQLAVEVALGADLVF